ncbi:hypothetical protein C1N91_06805 [Curtobacterium sp. SGAir0471]|nr:hypothetical protein C1N91_06805 [Curtobacterium sp. SGAir0471]
MVVPPSSRSRTRSPTARSVSAAGRSPSTLMPVTTCTRPPCRSTSTRTSGSCRRSGAGVTASTTVSATAATGRGG